MRCGDDYRALHDKLGAHHGDDHPRHGRGAAAGRPHRGDARAENCWRWARPPELSDSGDAYVGELLATPRRAGRAARRAAAAGRRGMSLLSDPRWGEALAHLPDYLGNHVLVSVTRAGARACDQPAAGDRRARPAAVPRRAARRRQHRADHPRPGAARAVLSAAAGARVADAAPVRLRLLRARLPAVGAGAHALFDAAGAAQHHHRAERRRSGARSRPPRASA